MEIQAAAKLEPFLLTAKGSRGAATAKVIEQATAAPGVFVFSELLQLPSVKELETSETYAPHYALLQLFAYGTFSMYAAAPQAYPPLNAQQITKLKQLSVVTLGAQSRTLPYEALLTTLDIANVRALEDLLIDAIFLQILRGKMDQQRKCFLVDEVLGRDLTPAALASVHQQLQDWAGVQQQLVNDLSATITLAQSSAGQHQSQLLAYQMQKDAAIEEASKAPDQRMVAGGLEESAKGKGKKSSGRAINELIPDVKETLQYFRSLGKDIVFVSNNATKSRSQYKKKFDKLGIQASEEEIFGSAYASAVYIAQILKLPSDKKVYVIGEGGLEDELRAEGLNVCGGTSAEANKPLPSQDFSDVQRDPDVGAVLCGFDTYVNYRKLATAHMCLMHNDGCHFVLTNEDSTFPSHGAFYPGSGAISAPLKYSTEKTPIVVGKPNKSMMDCIVAKRHFDVKRTLMVGDRLNTDIEFGNSSGTSTLLVLTGVNQVADIAASGTTPTFVVDSLGSFKVLADSA